MKVVIAFSGKKLSGKSTACEFCSRYFSSMGYTTTILNFADAVKALVLDYFIPAQYKLLREDLNKDEVKNMKIGKYTVRQMLQMVGTDMMRSIDENCWINVFNKELIRTPADIIFCGDLRFKNELDYFQSLPFKSSTIRLTRVVTTDNHASETDLDDSMDKFDYVVDNADLEIADKNKQLRVICESIAKCLISR